MAGQSNVRHSPRTRNKSPGGLVAGDAHIPTLDELRTEGKACAARIRWNERITNLTTRDTLNEWFDQAHRLAMARSSHGLKGSTFERFAFDIGINGKWCYDIELLDGNRDIVFTKCEELEHEALTDGHEYRWPGWRTALEMALPGKARAPNLTRQLADAKRKIEELEKELSQSNPRWSAASYLQSYQKGSDDRPTPQHVFDYLDRLHRFDLDVAASAKNAKVKRFFTRKQDALRQTWNCEAAWMNPPFSLLKEFVQKAYEETKIGRAKKIVGLLPAYVDRPWFHAYVRHAQVTVFEGRLIFLNSLGTAPFATIVAVWKHGCSNTSDQMTIKLTKVPRKTSTTTRT